jgi:hypothetical protein
LVTSTTSTLPEDRGLAPARLDRRISFGLLAFFLVVVVLAVLGLLGVKSTSTSTLLPDGTEVEVHYARITRPGLATPWAVRVSREGGFDGPIVVRSSSAYFDLFDENGLDPEPTGSTQDGEMVIWEFDPPPGETFRLAFDARIEPGAQWGRDAITEVEVGGQVATLTYRTWVLP